MLSLALITEVLILEILGISDIFEGTESAAVSEEHINMRKIVNKYIPIFNLKFVTKYFIIFIQNPDSEMMNKPLMIEAPQTR